jgi:conjugal transfer pilin signal peptidase TrbI
MKFYREIRKVIFAFCCVFLGIGMLSHYIHIVVNRTPSVPYKVFLHFTRETPQKGDYTLIFNSFYGGLMIKKIMGKDGDSITFDPHNNLYVGEKKIGKLYLHTSHKKPLHPIEKQIIPKDFVFVYAPHKKSFDSRYKEVGLIHKKDLHGLLIPVI